MAYAARRNEGALQGFIQTVAAGVLGALGFLLWDAFAPVIGLPRLDLPALLGTIFAGDVATLSSLGVLMHLGVGVGLGLFYVYGDVEEFLPGPSWLRGMIYGAGVWVVTMVAVMPLIPYADRVLGQGQAPTMGFFMLTVGVWAPVQALVTHLIFGAVLGLVAGRRGFPFFWRSIIAGLLGALAFALWDSLAPLAGLPALEFPRLAGSQFVTDPQRIAVGGLVVHLLIGVLFAVIYLRAGLWQVLPGTAAVRGVIYGILIWLFAMLVIMPFLIGKGFFMLDAGIIAPIGALVVHLIYGFLVGVIVSPPRTTVTPL
ncbi:MAG: hypothetical protein IT330_04895 [Anaerolineae bacterium]|nr:hypothetical protein [Anaerolineae bacterium]